MHAKSDWPAKEGSNSVVEQRNASLHDRLIDSALAVAAVTGVCYAIGYMVEIRRAQDLGLSLNLLPEKPIQSILVIGWLNLLICILIIMFIVAIVVACTWPLWKDGGVGRHYLTRNVGAHPYSWSASIGMLIFISCIILTAHIPYIDPWRGNVQDFSTITDIQLKNGKQHLDSSGWRFINSTHGWTIVRVGDKRFRLIRSDDIEVIGLGPKSPP
jgi:hypothetical protein